MNKPPYICAKCEGRYGPMIGPVSGSPIYAACSCSGIDKDEVYFVDLNKMEIKGKIENVGEPMTQKTEFAVHRIAGRQLQEWCPSTSVWLGTSWLDEGPYSIVPDPSKPKEVEDEYERDKKALIRNIEFASVRDEREAIVEFLEKWYPRKETGNV